ncbi:MAG: energy-coupling factor transporter transmembrane component T [Sphaerochaetaceae bacterium]|jgi:energy-coupling factor transport system permease protein|nr:energy-coupling factor transporter transmembrane component T [Sphaerochaetaceae bacterium]
MTTNMFIAGKGWLYRFDPRAKIIGLLLLCIQLFLPMRQFGLWLTVVFSLSLTIRSVGFKQSLAPLKMMLPLLIIMTLFVPLTYRDGQAMIAIGSFTIATKESLLQLSRLASRLISITYLCTLFFWTTEMSDILLSFRWYGLGYRSSLVLTLSFRFIPFIADALKMIIDSHALREANIGEKKNRKRRLADAVPTVTSALVFALKAIPNLAMSLEHRGFGRSNRRTVYHVLPSSSSLFTHMVVSVIIPVGYWVLLRMWN